MRTIWMLLAIALVLVTACAGGGNTSEAEPSPSVPVTETAQATATPETILTVDPSLTPAVQIRQDLAARLGIAESQIAIQGLWFVSWEKESLECPPPPDPAFTVDHVMIVTESGSRYERTTRDSDRDRFSAVLSILMVDDVLYPYYMVNEQLLFCPLD